MEQKIFTWNERDGDSLKAETESLIKCGYVVVCIVPTSYRASNDEKVIREAFIIVNIIPSPTFG
jgi:hypothetical protein